MEKGNRTDFIDSDRESTQNERAKLAGEKRKARESNRQQTIKFLILVENYKNILKFFHVRNYLQKFRKFNSFNDYIDVIFYKGKLLSTRVETSPNDAPDVFPYLRVVSIFEFIFNFPAILINKFFYYQHETLAFTLPKEYAISFTQVVTPLVNKISSTFI